MRVAELLGCRLFDRDGVEVGSVHDVRFVADGPPYPGTGRPSYRLAALIVGDTALGHRLGFARHEMTGPWPLPSLFRRLARRSYLVQWEDVNRFARPRIEIGRSIAELRPAVDDSGGPP